MNSYIHIPFCKQKCSYCKFALTPIFDNYKKQKYLKFLEKEITTKLEKYKKFPIETIYFGGGTPSILETEEIEKILSLFPEGEKEISFESNPEDLNKNFLEKIFSLGINRLSIGVQTLNDKSLKIIERQNSETTINALNSLKSLEVGKVGFFGNEKISINIDFILGLPYVKKGEILENISFLHKNFPFITHTSVYILEKGMYPKNWKNVSISETEITEDYEKICEYFKEKGWNHYEFSNFAKPGYECKHNLGYWNHADTLGFGLSASEFLQEKNGKFSAVRRTNSLSFSGYYKGKILEEEGLTEEQIELEKFLFGMRTNGYLLNPKIPILSEEKILFFEKEGFIQKIDKKILLTKKGFPLIDHITENLLQ